jgi:hypothetical protein
MRIASQVIALALATSAADPVVAAQLNGGMPTYPDSRNPRPHRRLQLIKEDFQ